MLTAEAVEQRKQLRENADVQQVSTGPLEWDMGKRLPAIVTGTFSRQPVSPVHITRSCVPAHISYLNATALQRHISHLMCLYADVQKVQQVLE
jgi:hypothetical protein